jgi:nicotinamidase-related amidase
MPHTALLLIDIQQSFRQRKFWSEDNVPAFLQRVHALAEGCASLGTPIVRIFHADGPESSDNPFSHASGLVRPLEGLRELPIAVTFEKHRHSALVGTGLADWLRQRGITRLIVCGIRTEQCCETTARHASDEGWSVDFVGEATLTFPMQTPAGSTLDAVTLRERTETVLQGRFATLCTVEQALARAARAETSADAQA